MKDPMMVPQASPDAPRNAKLDLEWLPEELAAHLDTDIATIASYIAFDAPLATLAKTDERLSDDAQFRANVLPLVRICALPVRFGDLMETWKPGDPLPDRHSEEARKAEWQRFMKSAPRFFPFPRLGEVIRPTWRRVTVVFAVLIGLTAARAAFVGKAVNGAWTTGTADNRAGNALPPGAGIAKPITYETGARDSVVAFDRADVTLHANSRLAMSTVARSNAIGAIDGEADIVVHKPKTFAVRQAEVVFTMFPGRYRISHVPGGATRIQVDTGRVWLGARLNPRYMTGTVIRADARGSMTTVTAVARDGTDLETVTMRNLMAAAR